MGNGLKSSSWRNYKEKLQAEKPRAGEKMLIMAATLGYYQFFMKTCSSIS